MNDKELLEFAAKAAGIFLTKEELAEKLPEWEWTEDFEPYHLRNGGMSGSIIWYGSNGEIGGTDSLSWYPLEDDGDALRLAVLLGISPEWGGFDVEICRHHSGAREFCYVEPHDSDPYAATRRAIVRAAAEVGRNMK